ncbi:MAG TPA: hypothetical protein VMS00_14115 [Acidimicrobiales bacterium]|nr:hypothetical protein [Acidimicrobiales bacterium]
MKARARAGARLLAVGCAAAVVGGLMPISSTSGSAFPARLGQVPSECHPAVLAGAGRFLANFTTVCKVTSTVPANGDLGPHGITVIPATVGRLVAGDVLISNSNNRNNVPGTGSTIAEISPKTGVLRLFANVAAQTHTPVGLTAALAVFHDGYVVVGSLPRTKATAETSTAVALYILNSRGRLVQTVRGDDISGPWDMASYDGGDFGVLFVTNVMPGGGASSGRVVHNGDVVRLVLDLVASRPTVVHHVIIASGFGEMTGPVGRVNGPTGLAYAPNGTIYVADTLANRIAAIPDGMSRLTSAGTGRTVTSGNFLEAPLGLVQAPDGDLLSTNAGNGQIVESTLYGGPGFLFGDQPEWPTVDSSGSGALFGLAVQPGEKGVYFVDNLTHSLDIFM